MIALVSVYDEDLPLFEKMLLSLRDVVETIHVVDGAWGDFDPHNADGNSNNETLDLAASYDAVIHPHGRWVSQEQKRTQMFRIPGWEYALVIDADEEFFGIPTQVKGHSCVLLQNVGPNDLPGMRGCFPHGDYTTEPQALLRIFQYDSELVCHWPGRYTDSRGHIRTYKRDNTTRLPVLEGVGIWHYPSQRSETRISLKREWYPTEIENRKPLQDAMWESNPW